MAGLALGAGLGGCAGPSRPGVNAGTASRQPGLSCAPFARELSGLRLYGSAADWWDRAAGRYPRVSQPEIGSVLVLRRERRLPDGHVAVVSRIAGDRQVMLIQANWVAGELAIDQLAVDVSGGNDWTEVRMWWPPTDTLGAHAYAAFGFIRPPRATTAEALRQEAPGAARRGLLARG